MRTIREAKNLKNKRVLVRVDWNEPIEEGRVRNDFRIRQTLATLEFLKEKGAKVIVATHLEPTDASLDSLKSYLPQGAELLENLRLNPGEEANDKKFAASLSSKADIYVNEAFSVSHRSHASIVGVPKLLPSYVGLQFAREVEELSRVFAPPRPFFLILGGAKFETKLPLVEKFLPNTDFVFIGGGMAKAATKLVAKSASWRTKVIFSTPDPAAIDANEETLALIEEKINLSKFILWNGPVGNYEKGYKSGTLTLAKLLANSNAQVVVGGGDTLAVIEELDILEKFSFVSTAGGAMLDFLASGTLPGIEVLS